MPDFKQISPFFTTIIRRKIKLVSTVGGVFLFFLIILIFAGGDFFRPNISEGIVGVYEEGNLPDIVTNLVSTGLVSIDESGLPKPNLAEKWIVNPEGTVYDIKIKRNLNWSDGSQIKSTDINLVLSDVLASYPDLQTVEYKINDSFSPFLSLLSKPVFKNGTHIGTGPYKIDQIKKDNYIVKKLTLKPVSDKKLPDITVRFYPSEKIAKNALKIGEIQSLFGLNESTMDFKDQTLVKFSKPTYKQIVTIFYNTKDAILSDENFRLALSFASPVIKNEVRAKTSISPISWAFNASDDIKEYLGNTEQAKSYLSKVKNGRDNTITLTVTSSLKSAGERVVDAWNKMGIKSVLRVESGIPQNFQALLITQNIPSDPDQYALWHSTQTQTNISKISHPRIDKDLEDGRKSTDQEVRKARYLDFQKILLDRAPATFLYFPKYNVIYLKKIEGNLKKVLDLQLSGV